MLAGVLMGLGASACWALANVAIARAGRSLGSLRALLWAQLWGAGLAALASAALEQPNLTLDAIAAHGGWIGVACVSSLLALLTMTIWSAGRVCASSECRHPGRRRASL